MKKTLIATLAVVAGLTAVSSTFAFQNNMGNTRMETETRTQLMEIFQNKDYASFMDMFEGTKITERLNTQEAFDAIADKIVAKQAERGERIEDREEKQTEREDHRAEMEANHEAMATAIEAGDYTTWAELAPEQMTEIIDSEAKFEKLQELHELREKARVISEELGLNNIRKEHSQERMENHPRMDNEKMDGRFGMWDKE